MQVKLLGAHNCESESTRLISVLIDGTLAIDAGSLTSSLSLSAQEQITSILLTHRHFDHVRDIATIGINTCFSRTTKVYSIDSVLSVVSAHIVNRIIYPDFTQIPTQYNPSLKFYTLEPHEPETVDDYQVLAIPVNHNVPTVGYQVTSEDEESIFYTGDTGPGLYHCWWHIQPQLLIVEATLPNRHGDLALDTGHLTPEILGMELATFHRMKGYLPRVVVVHMSPQFENDIKDEIEQVAKELRTDITLGYEGMEISL